MNEENKQGEILGKESKKYGSSRSSMETEKLHAFFRNIWDEREDEEGYCYCYETGRPMHGSQFRSNSAVYDHVLEKNTRAYPQYKFTKKNIIIVHPEIHQQKNQSIENTPKIKAYMEHLLSLHYDGKLKD